MTFSTLRITAAIGFLSMALPACNVDTGITTDPATTAESDYEALTADKPYTGIVQTGVNIIKAVHSGKALDVPGASRAYGTQMVQWDANGTGSQEWRLGSPGSYLYQFANSVTNACLTVKDGSRNDGAPITQTACNATDPLQQFYALDAGNGAVTFRNRVTGKCLDVSGSSQASGAPIVQFACNGQQNQQWRITNIFGD